MNVLTLIFSFDDFCKAFRGLGNRISYVYKHGLKPGKYEISTFHVIVDGMYWDFLFKPETHLTKFYDQESLLAPVFTDQYIGATCLWIGGDREKCDTLLFSKGETISKVMVTRVTNDNHENAKYLNEFPKPEEWTVSGLPQQKYAFVHDSGLYDNRMDFAIGSTPGKQFSRLYYKFEDRNGEKSFAAIKTSDKDTDMTKNFDMDMEVIGIWYQWSNKEKSFGHIVFMRDNLKVFWCWKKISDNKCEGIPLVDCTDTNTPQSPIPDERSSFWIYIVIALIIVITVLVIIGIIVFIMFGKKSVNKPKEKRPNGRSNVISADNSKTSIRSLDQ